MSDALLTSVPRVDAPLVADERTALEAWLEYHRATLLTKCAGLGEAELKRASAPPSSLTLLGLVRHMAEVENWWFTIVMGGAEDRDIYCSEQFPDGEFDLVADADAAADLQTFREEVDRARAAAARFPSLDATAQPPGNGQPRDLRWIYLHMIEEYARHNGHADILRERIDGATGE